MSDSLESDRDKRWDGTGVLVDFEAIDRVLRGRRPRRVGVSAPDGLQSAARSVYDHLRKLGIEPVIILDPTYGFCDLQDGQADALGLDLVFNLGHWSPARLSERTLLVDVEYEVPISRLQALADSIVGAARREGWRTVGLLAIGNYGRVRGKLADLLRRADVVVLPEREEITGSLLNWQVTGCMFPGAWSIRRRVDAFALLGSSRFHAIAVRLATGSRTIMADPESLEISDVEDDATRTARRAALAIYRAADARSFGIVVGEKSGQRYPELARAIGRSLEELGRSVYYYSAYEITADRLGVARGVDAFIVLACPRIGLDAAGGDRPVLSYPQAIQLLNLLRGKSLNMDELLRMPLWAWVGYERHER
ncbi:MAG: diphthamide synthesis protein [Conexivisphaera sp.]